MIAVVRINGNFVTIKTPHNDPDDIAPVVFGGKVSDVLDVQLGLSGASGYYGHSIDLKRTTNLDLQFAIVSLPLWEVLSVSPQISPNPLPPGVVS